MCLTDLADKIHNLPRYHDDFKRQNRTSWHADASCLDGFVLGSCCTCTPVLLRLSPNKASTCQSVSISHRIICEIRSQSSQMQKAPISVRLMCLNALQLCSYSRTEAITRWFEGRVIRECETPSSHHAIEAYLNKILIWLSWTAWYKSNYQVTVQSNGVGVKWDRNRREGTGGQRYS